MKLNVLAADEAVQPWYAQGLKFTCTQCGNCCTGGPGVVWISREEIQRLAEHLKLSATEVIDRYCRKVAGKYSLTEFRNPQHGGYDCVFLKEEKVPAMHDGKTVTQTRRGCSIYAARPLQCRTWPFWKQNLESPETWNHSSKKCPGMNTGRHFDLARIEALKDAKDWPQSPPTSSERSL